LEITEGKKKILTACGIKGNTKEGKGKRRGNVMLSEAGSTAVGRKR